MDISQSAQAILNNLRRTSGKISTSTDPEVFLLDVLDTLCQESTPESGKLQLLTVLQENITWATLKFTSVEHVIGSLKNMYLYPAKNASEFYKSQLLVTLTVVLIMTSSKLQNLQEDCETLHSSIQFLSDVISKVNHLPSALTRKTACECLWEIEICYPGLLQDRLGYFFKLCEEERSAIFQSYMTLFVTTLKNAIVHLSMFHEKFPENENYLNELLSSETDLSMKMNYLFELGLLEEQFPVILNVGNGQIFDVRLPSKFKDKELKRAVSYIQENCNLLTNIPLFHVLIQIEFSALLLNLIEQRPRRKKAWYYREIWNTVYSWLMHCIKLASLSSSVFKSQFVNSLSTTMDLPLFQLVLLLKLTFSTQLIEEADTVILLQRLTQLSNQPNLLSGERLLCYQWLIHFSQKAEDGSALAELIDFTQKANFHPTVFDPLEIIPGKLNVLSSCYIVGGGPDIATATLMNSLLCLHKPIKHGLKRPFATMLFQVLFSYYSRHRDTALVQEIYRFLLSFVTEQPDMVPYILDFVLSVSLLTPDSYLPCEVLRNFTDYIMALPLEKQMENINSYLKAFEYAMKLKNIPPAGTIGYLQELVQSDEIRRKGGWTVGNAILQVCRNILQYHDTSKIISEFGECLLTINKSYHDIDICDRAILYYSLLTSISTEKCSRLLTGDFRKLTQGLEHDGRTGIETSAFATAPPIKEIKKPFLSLTRISSVLKLTCSSQNVSEQDSESADCSTANVEDTFSSYLEEIENKADETSILIPFYLHYNTEPGEEVPATVFAAVIQLQTTSSYKPIADIHIPYLSYRNSNNPWEGCQVVEIQFSPKQPVPASLNVRIIYSTTSGCSHIMMLKPITIQFSDLFIPLGQQTPSLPSLKHTLSPIQLFDELWKHIERHQYSRKNRDFICAKSLVYLDIGSEKVDSILEQLASHVIYNNDSETLVGVVLPPKHHFLLRFMIHPSHAVVHIETDKWEILGLVAEYLKNTDEDPTRNSELY